MKKIPFQNQALTDIKGEIWKPIPGFEGYYDVSSFGRIKALEREYVHNTGGLSLKQEKILKQALTCVRSKSCPHDSFSLSVSLWLGGIAYPVKISRLVYDLFVESFDLTDKRILISYKDWDGRNLHYRNLYKTSISEIMQKSFDQGRYKAHLNILSKPVSQFDISGNWIASFPSLYDASKQTGFNDRAISHVANGKGNVYQGYIWQFGKSKKLVANKLIQKRDGDINQQLAEKLGTAGLADYKNPLVSLSLKNFKGEQWKFIPGYEGLYQLSNYGRVKAIAGLSDGQIKIWHPDFIKRINLKQKNMTSIRYPAVTLSKGSERKTLTIARYVYFMFVQEFDLHDNKIKIGYADGKASNVHFKNLFLK